MLKDTLNQLKLALQKNGMIYDAFIDDFEISKAILSLGRPKFKLRLQKYLEIPLKVTRKPIKIPKIGIKIQK